LIDNINTEVIMARKRNSINDRLERIESAVTQQTDEVLTSKQAAAYLDISIHHLWRLTSQGRIPHYKPGGKRLYFRRSELDEWIFSRKVHTVDELVSDDVLYPRRRPTRTIREPDSGYEALHGCSSSTAGASFCAPQVDVITSLPNEYAAACAPGLFSGWRPTPVSQGNGKSADKIIQYFFLKYTHMNYDDGKSAEESSHV
jgi:excisionase family DNA binding protein